MVAYWTPPSTLDLTWWSLETVPLQPNHSPPRCAMSPDNATARPPAVAPALGGGTRLDTTTRRFI